MKITFPGAYVKNFSWLASFRRSHPTRLPSLAASLRAETPRSSINKYRHDHFLDASHPGGENTLTRLGRRSVRTSHRGGENRSPPPALPKVRPARIPRHSHSPPPLRREILVPRLAIYGIPTRTRTQSVKIPPQRTPGCVPHISRVSDRGRFLSVLDLVPIVSVFVCWDSCPIRCRVNDCDPHRGQALARSPTSATRVLAFESRRDTLRSCRSGTTGEVVTSY